MCLTVTGFEFRCLGVLSGVTVAHSMLNRFLLPRRQYLTTGLKCVRPQVKLDSLPDIFVSDQPIFILISEASYLAHGRTSRALMRAV